MKELLSTLSDICGTSNLFSTKMYHTNIERQQSKYTEDAK
jgi:hypothetical protein